MKLRRVTAWGLVFAMTLCLDVSAVNAASGNVDMKTTPVGISAQDTEAQKQMAQGVGGQIPGTDRTFFDENDDIRDYFNISGYVAEGVQDRSEYYEEYVAKGKKNTKNYIVVEEDGYWKRGTSDYITKDAYDQLDASEQANYSFVTAEVQFLSALANQPKVVQVNAEELELGFHYLQKIGAPQSNVEQVTDYTKKAPPITNPTIMHKDDDDLPEGIDGVIDFEGTGLSDLNLYSHLTIFSTTGCVIRHAGIDLGGREDVIIRNFRLEGMYEWDDILTKATTYQEHVTRKRYGWCNVSLNDSDNIWVDHCTFGFAFDGNLDIKNGSSVSVTWCQFGVQDMNTADEENLDTLPKWNESKGCELWKNILYMEEYYQEYKAGNTNGYHYQDYTKYRDAGATPKEIFRYAALHSKVHLCGSGEGDFYTNVKEKITLGFNYYTNIMQRIPMIRSGNGHMYNCIVDNEEYQANAKAVAQKVEAAGSQRGYTTYISVNNARNGATIGTDTCIFKDVTPCTGGETQKDTGGINDETWENILANAVNHSLVVNSSVTFKGQTYIGSSWDNNGDNLFTKDKWTWTDKSSIGDFKWAKWKDLDQFLNTGSYNADQTTANIVAWTKANGAQNFYRNFYVGQPELEYAYKCFDLDDVETMLSKYGGAQKNLYTLDGGEETPLDYIQPYNMQSMKDEYAKKVTFNANGATVADRTGNTTYLKVGESVVLPTAEEMSRGEGYIFMGWKKGSYDENGELKLEEELQGANERGEVVITAGTNGYTEERYYAIWEIATYTISFDSMGGSEVAPMKIQHGQTITAAGGLPADPVREGCTFLGWYQIYNSDKNTYIGKVNGRTTFTEDTTLYAKWDGDDEPDPGPGPEPTGTLGNVNGDTKIVDDEEVPCIDSKDALAVLKYALSLDPGEDFDVTVANVNGDTNEDGEAIIDSKDALEILKYSLGLIDKFSAEETDISE